jgi:SAM-dependent methyltransferase
MDQSTYTHEHDKTHYERDDTVSTFLNAYEIEKERQFIKRIDRFIPKDQIHLLDIGCGLGLHASLWLERNKKVTASDFSTKFRDYIVENYDFPFIRAAIGSPLELLGERTTYQEVLSKSRFDLDLSYLPRIPG